MLGISDMSEQVSSTQIGASFAQTNVSLWCIDIKVGCSARGMLVCVCDYMWDVYLLVEAEALEQRWSLLRSTIT